MFGPRDIGRIEREFLAVLDFNLGFTESDVLAHHAQLSTFVLSWVGTSPIVPPRLVLPSEEACSPMTPYSEHCGAMSPSTSSDESSPDMPVTPADLPRPSVAAAASISALRVMLSPSYASQHAEATEVLKRKASRSKLHAFKRGLFGSSSRPQPEQQLLGYAG